MRISVYGKGGIGKSTVSSNLSVALAKRGKKVLQIGCDPKHDSTFTIAGKLIPTVIDVLEEENYKYEEIDENDIIFPGYGGVDTVEAGGPAPGLGCGGYVVGEVVKLLHQLDVYEKYDVMIFDVLEDVVCGGFSVPLQQSDYVCIVTANDFDSLFAANRIITSIKEKSKTYPVKLAGIIGNRTDIQDLIDVYAKKVGAPIINVVPLSEEIRMSRVNGKTLFAIEEEGGGSKNNLTGNFLAIADYLLASPEKIEIEPLGDREVFSLLRKSSLE